GRIEGALGEQRAEIVGQPEGDEEGVGHRSGTEQRRRQQIAREAEKAADQRQAADRGDATQQEAGRVRGWSWRATLAAQAPRRQAPCTGIYIQPITVDISLSRTETRQLRLGPRWARRLAGAPGSSRAASLERFQSHRHIHGQDRGLWLLVPVRGAEPGPTASRLSKEKVGMTRLSLVNSPFLLGFEHVERTLDRIAKTAGEGYPPYNIEQIGPNRLRITLAVAGFTRSDLSIEVENNQLT